jgi:hypothetical protein
MANEGLLRMWESRREAFAGIRRQGGRFGWDGDRIMLRSANVGRGGGLWTMRSRAEGAAGRWHIAGVTRRGKKSRCSHRRLEHQSLVKTDGNFDPVTGMPVMSALPVNIRSSSTAVTSEAEVDLAT